MIIIGTKRVQSTIKQGQFLCPRCNSINSYKHKKIINFFSLYFIPLIPLGKAGEFVVCQTCSNTYTPHVLEFEYTFEQPNFQTIFEEAIRHSMVLIMLADGKTDEKEMKVVHSIINIFSYNNLSLEEFKKNVLEIERNPEPVDKYLAKIAPFLNEVNKEMIIKCGLKVAFADKSIDDSEISIIHKMANSLGMPSSQLKEIMHNFKQI